MQKTALVTGGARRVGKAITQGLAKAGYSLAIHYNSSSDSADRLRSEIVANGGAAATFKADLADTVQANALFARARKELGDIDLLINNASLFEEDAYDALDEATWDRHFALHVKAPVQLASAFSKQKLGDGLIVNIIDDRVWKLSPNFASYTLSKSSLWTATRTMAQKFAPNIRVNAIGPGPTLPSLHQTNDQFERQLQSLLLQRAPQLDEIVDTILYFVRARSVTGQMIALDGGQHLGWQTPDQLVEK